MRIIPMCFSILQVPRCRLHTLANFWQGSFYSSRRKCGNNSSFGLLGCKANRLEGGYSRRWIRRPVSTNTEGTNKITQNKSKSINIRPEILDETVSTTATLNISKTDRGEYQNIQYCDIRQEILENNDLAKLVTVIVFDLETTGFCKQYERIIEIALLDLNGGKNSTFQTLVNPGRFVPSSGPHGIRTDMVCKPHVPRMEELIPILLQYVRSRQKPGGYVLLVAHNGRTFDVPFLVHEFKRCGFDVPPNWLFIDTLPLARRWMKSIGLKSSASLQSLRQTFGIKLEGSAHRAMADVKILAKLFQMLTFNLRTTLPSLVAESFTASEAMEVKKKKN